jgi:glucose/arabinose dehydrogenase
VRFWIVLLLATVMRAARPDGEVAAAGFAQIVWASGFSFPTAFAFLPDGRALVTEQGGGLLLVNGPVVTPIAQIPVASILNAGLLGVAIDPGFDSNGFVYLFRTKEGVNGELDLNGRYGEILRITLAGDGTVNMNTMVVLLSGIRTDTGYHNGGALRIGPDSKLYAATGDTGTGDFGGGPPGTSTNPYAQTLDALEGKVLRLNLDGTIPADNPFVGCKGVRGEIFAYGFRNPWRLAFDPITKNLWLGDVGEATAEEIDIVEAGRNYGWPICEAQLPKVAAGTTPPAFSYLHEGTPWLGTCVSGIAFAPQQFGTHAGGYFGGSLFFGDFIAGRIYRASLDKSRTGLHGEPVAFVNNTAGVTDLAFGPNGALYYLSCLAGELRRVAPPVGGGKQCVFGRSFALRSKSAPQHQCSICMEGSGAIDLGGALDNPMVYGGSVRIVAKKVSHTAALPAQHWKFLGKPPFNVAGFVYKAPLCDAASPYKSIEVVAGKSYRISGLSDELAAELSSDPGPVHVDLTLGKRKFCAEFGGDRKFIIGKSLFAKNAPPPSSCPP